MAKKPAIDIRRPHSFDKATAREKAQGLAESMQEKMGIKWSWKGDTIEFSGKGAEGTVAVSDNEVHVQVFLGMLLKAMKGTLEGKINERLDKMLA